MTVPNVFPPPPTLPPKAYDEGYNKATSEAEIIARKRVAELSGSIDFRAMLMYGARAAGIAPTDPILDIGCGRPSLLELMAKAGHTGDRFGVDPNPGGFRSIPYVELASTPEARQAILGVTTLHQVWKKHFIEHTPSEPEYHSGLQLFKGDANNIPLPNNSVKLAISELSFYHVPPDRQFTALDEVKRVLRPDGVMAIHTSGEEYKKAMRTNQGRLGYALMGIMGQEVSFTDSLHAPFTSERAAEIVTGKFRHVYRMLVDRPLFINNTADREIVLNAYRTLRGTYQTIDGNSPTPGQFEDALYAVVITEWQQDVLHHRFSTDRLVQSLDFASDHKLDLSPDIFTKIQ